MTTLGIDIGTTSVKISQVIDGEQKRQWIRPHEATIEYFTLDKRSCRGVQNASKILDCCLELLAEVAKSIDTNQIIGVGVSGQQHGVVTWKEQDIVHGNHANVSPLFTWEFDGVSHSFLLTMREHDDIHGGYGCLTLAWLESEGLLREDHDRAGTISDLFVFLITKSIERLMCDQHAAAFGFYRSGKWIGPASESGRWQSLLPTVIVSAGSLAGQMQLAPYPTALPVTVSLGDNQATLYPLLEDDIAVINIGTSSQVTLMNRKGVDIRKGGPTRVDPYFDGNEIIVVASLNGGNVVEAMMRNICKWSMELMSDQSGYEIQFKTMMERVDQYAMQQSTNVRVSSNLFGERGSTSSGLSMEGIRSDTGIVEILSSMCDGIIHHLTSLFPLPPYVKRFRLAGAATTPRYSEPAKRIANILNMEVTMGENASAAYGAGLFAMHKLNS